VLLGVSGTPLWCKSIVQCTSIQLCGCKTEVNVLPSIQFNHRRIMLARVLVILQQRRPPRTCFCAGKMQPSSQTKQMRSVVECMSDNSVLPCHKGILDTCAAADTMTT
jgi:hypothetical protein